LSGKSSSQQNVLYNPVSKRDGDGKNQTDEEEEEEEPAGAFGCYLESVESS
jgi:hypothetical protein